MHTHVHAYLIVVSFSLEGILGDESVWGEGAVPVAARIAGRDALSLVHHGHWADLKLGPVGSITCGLNLGFVLQNCLICVGYGGLGFCSAYIMLQLEAIDLAVRGI